MKLIDSLPYELSDAFRTPVVELTQSATAAFERCPQRFVLRYKYGLVGRGFSAPLTIGTAFHKGMEILLDPKPYLSEAMRMIAAVQAVDAAFDKVLNDPDVFIGNAASKMDKYRCQATACIKAWWLNRPDPMPFTVSAVETIIRVDKDVSIADPLWKRMAGKKDGDVVSIDDGSKWLLENKTKSNITGFDWTSSLDMDHQTLWYIYSSNARDLDTEDKPSLPKGFWYNVVAKPQHRAAIGFDALLARMVEAMTGDPSKYFAMIPVLIDYQILDFHYRNWERLVKRIDNMGPEDVTCQPVACNDYRGCPYKLLCQRQVDAGNWEEVFNAPEIEMYKYEVPHHELDDDDVLDAEPVEETPKF